MIMKPAIKTALARISRLQSRDAARRVVTLCYHSVHPTKSIASASPVLFERHLQWLRENCEVIPFRHALDLQDRPRSKPAVAITFDDGFADNYDYAFPILRKHGVTATFFVSTGLVQEDPETLRRFQAIRPFPKEEYRPLTWKQIAEMRRAGMDFGAHTHTHSNLASLAPHDAEWEMRHSKDLLEEHLQEAITLFAYPFGKPNRHYTRETVRLAEKIGFQRAAAVLFRDLRPGDSPFEMPRFIVSNDSVATLAEKVAGYWDTLGWWQAKAPIWAARLVSPQEFAYDTV